MQATVTWMGHATVQLRLPDERVVLIDPWLEGNPACPDSLKNPQRCDMILLTHGHADHVGDVSRLVQAFKPPVVGNYDLCAALRSQMGDADYRGMNTGGTQTVDGVTVSMTQAFHSSALDSPNGPIYAGMPNGLVVDVPGLAKVYHAGDTDVFGDMKLIAELFEPAIAMLPIGDYFTMGAKGAAIAAGMLSPRSILPIHYATFPILAPSADAFREALPPDLRDRVIVPEVGQAMTWTADGLRL